MEYIKISKEDAIKAYKNANGDVKNTLFDLYGKDIPHEKIFTDLNSFEDCCAVTGDDPDDERFEEGTRDEIALKKLKVVTKAINPVGWKADWNNENQYKWRPWFYMNKPGFRFGESYCGISGTHSDGGSRLCFESRERCDYAAKQFLGLYRDLIY